MFTLLNWFLHKIFNLKTKFITRIIIQIDDYLREGVNFLSSLLYLGHSTDNLPNLAVQRSGWKSVTSLQRGRTWHLKEDGAWKKTSSSSLKEGQHWFNCWFFSSWGSPCTSSSTLWIPGSQQLLGFPILSQTIKLF